MRDGLLVEDTYRQAPSGMSRISGVGEREEFSRDGGGGREIIMIYEEEEVGGNNTVEISSGSKEFANLHISLDNMSSASDQEGGQNWGSSPVPSVVDSTDPNREQLREEVVQEEEVSGGFRMRVEEEEGFVGTDEEEEQGGERVNNAEGEGDEERERDDGNVGNNEGGGGRILTNGSVEGNRERDDRSILCMVSYTEEIGLILKHKGKLEKLMQMEGSTRNKKRVRGINEPFFIWGAKKQKLLGTQEGKAEHKMMLIYSS